MIGGANGMIHSPMPASATSAPDPSIRLAVPGDAPAIARVLAESFAEFQGAYTSGAFAATTPGAEQIEPRFREGPLWVATPTPAPTPFGVGVHGGAGVWRGALVGTVSAVPRGEALYIRSLAVLPAARGQRLGEALIRQAEAYAVAHGLRRLFLGTTPVLTGAIRLYERLGFVRSDAGPRDLLGTPLFMMIKELD